MHQLLLLFLSLPPLGILMIKKRGSSFSKWVFQYFPCLPSSTAVKMPLKLIQVRWSSAQVNPPLTSQSLGGSREPPKSGFYLSLFSFETYLLFRYFPPRATLIPFDWLAVYPYVSKDFYFSGKEKWVEISFVLCSLPVDWLIPIDSPESISGHKSAGLCDREWNRNRV